MLDGKVDVTELTDAQLTEAVAAAGRPPISPEEQEKRIREWDPVDLLVPEWEYLQKDPIGPHQEDPASGLTLSKQERGRDLPHAITRVLAVERLRKVNALVGFTRIDDMDRLGDLPRRLAPLARTPRRASPQLRAPVLRRRRSSSLRTAQVSWCPRPRATTTSTAC